MIQLTSCGQIKIVHIPICFVLSLLQVQLNLDVSLKCKCSLYAYKTEAMEPRSVYNELVQILQATIFLL